MCLLQSYWEQACSQNHCKVTNNYKIIIPSNMALYSICLLFLTMVKVGGGNLEYSALSCRNAEWTSLLACTTVGVWFWSHDEMQLTAIDNILVVNIVALQWFAVEHH